MLAGRPPEQTGVRGNAGKYGPTDSSRSRFHTYDRVLLANGWRGQYLGKFHSPYSYTQDDSGKSYFSKPVMWGESEGLKLLVLSGVCCYGSPHTFADFVGVLHRADPPSAKASLICSLMAPITLLRNTLDTLDPRQVPGRAGKNA